MSGIWIPIVFDLCGRLDLQEKIVLLNLAMKSSKFSLVANWNFPNKTGSGCIFFKKVWQPCKRLNFLSKRLKRQVHRLTLTSLTWVDKREKLFEMAAMPFICNGILLIQCNLPCFLPVLILKLASCFIPFNFVNNRY